MRAYIKQKLFYKTYLIKEGIQKFRKLFKFRIAHNLTKKTPEVKKMIHVDPHMAILGRGIGDLRPLKQSPKGP